jgi:hypothetical protein
LYVFNTAVVFFAKNGSFAAEKKNNSSIQKSFFAAVGGVICA